jgi:hypothetical protein
MMRLQGGVAAQQQQVVQPQAQAVQEPTRTGGINLTTCDLGASPNLQPKVMKPYRSSPLQQARQTELRKKAKK